MRYFKFLTLMFIFIFFFSCHKKEQVINPNAKDYFPLASGNYWEYEVIHWEVAEGQDSILEEHKVVQLVVDDKSIVKGKEFFKINRCDMEIYSEDNDSSISSSRRYYLRTEDEFLLIRGCDEEGNVLIDTLFHHPNIRNGKPWYVKGRYFYEGGLPYQAIYAGEEVVKLRIDSFNCVKINYSIDPNEDPGCDEFYFFEEEDFHTASFWYAKGVGIVKIVAEYLDDEESGAKDVYIWKLRDYYIKKEQ